ncbi:MAG: hypothetical protein IPL86_13260 [Flavobacteriales bacterium]|nr:hypothetical protein [Flavobacteriales bacterium]
MWTWLLSGRILTVTLSSPSGQWGADRSIANFLGFGFKSINTGGARIAEVK